MIRNLIFDWSGTLVDDLPAVWRTTNHVFRNAGVPELTLDEFRAEFALPFREFYERFVAHVPLPQLEAWFHTRFEQDQEPVEALPHAGSFLAFARQRGLRMFVLSTVRRDHFERQARQAGFAEFFEAAYLGVMDKRREIHEVLSRHRLSPEETLFIGDMQHDIEAAHEGGVRACAVLTGYNRLDQLRLSGPDLIVQHLGELQSFLERDDQNWLADASQMPPPP